MSFGPLKWSVKSIPPKTNAWHLKIGGFPQTEDPELGNHHFWKVHVSFWGCTMFNQFFDQLFGDDLDDGRSDNS